MTMTAKLHREWRQANLATLDLFLSKGCHVCGTHDNLVIHHEETTRAGGQGRKSTRSDAARYSPTAFKERLRGCRVYCVKHHLEYHRAEKKTREMMKRVEN